MSKTEQTAAGNPPAPQAGTPAPQMQAQLPGQGRPVQFTDWASI